MSFHFTLLVLSVLGLSTPWHNLYVTISDMAFDNVVVVIRLAQLLQAFT